MSQREAFEHAVVTQRGKHNMLVDLRRDSDGEYMSACERAAWWAWQQAKGINEKPERASKGICSCWLLPGEPSCVGCPEG